MPERAIGGTSGSGRMRLLVAALLSAGLLLGIAAVPAEASPYPPLPVALDRDFLGNLSAPNLSPGGSGVLTFTLTDPLPVALSGVEVTLSVYAFNAFPGNATSILPVAGAPVLTTASSSGETLVIVEGSIAPNATLSGSVGVTTSASTPSGAFAVRTAVSFSLASNGTAYRLASRGWFTTATWLAATELPNGSATLNLSVLGVSGVTPETVVYVASSTWVWVLTGLLVAGFALVGAGAWVYFRRGPGSRAGSR